MKGRQTAIDALSPLPDVHVVIVNYGTADLAIEAAASALSQNLPGRGLYVHIVDNASPGDDARRLAQAILDRHWQDRVTLLPETTNHGFGRGNNLVLTRLAEGHPDTYALLLNPDARLEPGTLGSLAALLDARADVGAVGPATMLPGGLPTTAAFRFPSLLGEFEMMASFGPVTRALSRHRIPLPPNHPEGPVDWVVGAAVMLRLSALRRVGFFDPGFFLYFEEVDLMRRLRDQGFITYYLPHALAEHREGTATGIGHGRWHRRPAYWFASWRHYHRSAEGRLGAILTALFHLSGALLHLATARLRGRSPSLPDRYLRDFLSLALVPLLLGEGTQDA